MSIEFLKPRLHLMCWYELQPCGLFVEGRVWLRVHTSEIQTGTDPFKKYSLLKHEFPTSRCKWNS